MVNIIVMVLSLPGDYLCVAENTVILEEASIGEKNPK